MFILAYTLSMMKLFDYQEEARTNIYNAWGRVPNVLFTLPCRGGKTVIFSSIIEDEPGASVVLQHRSELIMQSSLTLARRGIEHRVIGPSQLANACTKAHVLDTGMNFVNPTARVGVASVQTMVNIRQSDPWLKRIKLWVSDECFPAGSLVDGRPIESLVVGDYVNAFDDLTGRFESKKIVRLFKNKKPNQMVRVCIKGHHVIQCTLNHPFYTLRGWINAGNLLITDKVLHYDNMLHLQQPDRGFRNTTPERLISKNRASVLSRSGLHKNISSKMLIGNDVKNKQEICLETNDRKKPHAFRRNSAESINQFKSDGAQAFYPRGERETRNNCRTEFKYPFRRFKFCSPIHPTNFAENIQRGNFANPFQNRFGKSKVKNCNRNRWEFPQCTGETCPRQKERIVSDWVGVESVTVQERGSVGFPGGDFVYNIEVDGLHTYTVNNIVVHNCHHCIQGSTWEKVTNMLPNAHGLGVTATPIRADRKGLGRHANGLFDELVIGPTMRDLIDRGRICDYRLFSPNNDIDLSNVPTTSGGDFSPEPLRDAVHKSHIVGDCVNHYLKFGEGKQFLMFTVDVESAISQAEAFRQAGISCEAVSGKTEPTVRMNAIRNVKNRTIRGLVNCDLFGEGTDLPEVEVVIMGRPTQSYGLFVQQFCRPLTKLPGKDFGIVIDAVRNTRISVGDTEYGRHPLPDAPIKWSLDTAPKRVKSVDENQIMIRVCQACSGAYDKVVYGFSCPYCMFKNLPAERSKPEQVDGDLSELTPEALAAMRGQIEVVQHLPKIPYNATQVIENSIKKRYREHMDALALLKEVIAIWAASKTDIGKAQREFYLTFGIDVMTAQTLKTKDALLLIERVLK